MKYFLREFVPDDDLLTFVNFYDTWLVTLSILIFVLSTTRAHLVHNILCYFKNAEYRIQGFTLYSYSKLNLIEIIYIKLTRTLKT